MEGYWKSVFPKQWQQEFQEEFGCNQQKIEKLLGENKIYPFAVNRRTLRNDFRSLVDKGWLLDPTCQENDEVNGRYRYSKVEDWSKLLPSQGLDCAETKNGDVNSLIPNLDYCWEDFFTKIRGEQRFLIELENIIPGHRSRHVEDLVIKLKNIWNQHSIPPVQITYCSAKNYQEKFDCIVYPVCFYYIQRAPYLFAYGTMPQEEQEINWYDYRLDRILKLESLSWENTDKIPSQLSQKYQHDNLPTPQQVADEIQGSLGYDLHKPRQKLILRFNRYFHGNYIENTERESLLKKIDVEIVIKQIKSSPLEHQVRQHLLERIQQNSGDIYCLVESRKDDNHVRMRLRSWSPNVEVILPWDLRQQIRDDLHQTWQFYHQDCP